MMIGISGWLDAAHQSERMEIAVQLATDLMEEILAQDFADPDGSDSETLRADFDDVEDYNGWSSTPPKSAQGNTLSGYTGYTRSVSIIGVSQWDLSPQNPLVPGSTDYMVVTVRVDWDGDYITLVALKVNFSNQYYYYFPDDD